MKFKRTLRTYWGLNYISLSLYDLAENYYYQKKYREAEPLFKRTINIIEKNYGTNYKELPKILDYLSKIYTELGELDEANKMDERAEKIRSNN